LFFLKQVKLILEVFPLYSLVQFDISQLMQDLLNNIALEHSEAQRLDAFVLLNAGRNSWYSRGFPQLQQQLFGNLIP